MYSYVDTEIQIRRSGLTDTAGLFNDLKIKKETTSMKNLSVSRRNLNQRKQNTITTVFSVCFGHKMVNAYICVS